MKKLFSTLFLLGAVLAFTACGSDDEDLRLYDTAILAGTYTGTCKVEVTDIQRPEVTSNTEVAIIKTSDANTLALDKTTEFGDFITNPKLTNFMSTKGKDAYTFSMEGASISTSGSGVPVYVTTWFGNDFSSISSASITLNSTSAKYTINNKALEFVYTGKLEVKGTVNNVEQAPKTYSIRYTYSVVKK